MVAHGEVDPAGLRALVDSPNGPVWRMLLLVGVRIRNGAVDRCNVDTGRLRSSITGPVPASGANPTVRVGTDVDYAVYVHEGTNPHFIFPVHKRYLSWVTPAGRVFARAVAHPG